LEKCDSASERKKKKIMKHIKLFEEFVTEDLLEGAKLTLPIQYTTYEELLIEAKKIKDRGEAPLPNYYDAIKNYFGPEQEKALKDLGVEVDRQGPNIVICKWKTQEGGNAVREEVSRLLKKVFKGSWPSSLLNDWNDNFYR